MSLKHGPPPPRSSRSQSVAGCRTTACFAGVQNTSPPCAGLCLRQLQVPQKHCQMPNCIPSLSHHITTALAAASASSPNSGQARRRWYCETGHTKTPRARSIDITAFPDSCTLPETQYRPGHFHDNEIPWILLENGSAQRNRMEVDDLGFVPQQDCERCR